MKTCTICFKPIPEKIDQYGPSDFIVCQDCFHLDSEHKLSRYSINVLRNGDRIIIDAHDDEGYIHLLRPYEYELPLFVFGTTYLHTKPITTQYVARKQTQRQHAKRKKVYV